MYLAGDFFQIMAETVDRHKEDVSKKKEVLGETIGQEEYILRKRLPKTFPKRKNDIYVNKKTDFKAQLARCQRLLDNGENELYIHGLGAALNRAINLALQLKALGNGSIEVSANTSTVELVDDYEPMDDESEPDQSTRNNSAIHIKVYRPEEPLPPGACGKPYATKVSL